jgi:hypothetical protein
MQFTRSIGMILLALYLILIGIGLIFGVMTPAIILGLIAIVAGVLILFGK